MSGLRVYHNSQNTDYRDPFGARPCGGQVTLRLAVSSGSPVEECLVRLSMKKEQVVQAMQAVRLESLPSAAHLPAGSAFQAIVNLPREPGLVWYFFELKVDGEMYYYHNNWDELGGEGVLSRQEGPPFQITVHKPSAIPRWFKEGIMYQIHVDRFFNGNPDGRILNPKKKALIHAHWDDDPVYVRDEKGKVVRWTFFGGNLQGVIAKLPYLQELGISIIYFNPIFEAASNHKYDTGDYLKIDPMYGDVETFVRLVHEAAKVGISVILDGVFSHTGSDSRYFNKYGHYPELGAYQAEVSPYYPWYRLKCPGGEYECWWGEEDLPNVNELEPSYLDFILGRENGVARFWLRKGAKGWRLDVADELPDEFIKLLRKAVKKTDPEAVLIGEVWEDASNKISYGERREYLWGEELDSVMNYPLRDILLRYFLGINGATETVARMMSLYENYPPENFRAAMNIIGSHDRIRILTLLGEAPAEASLTHRARESFRLSAPAREKGVKRLKLIVLLQMTLPGVPCVYYGDEAGLEGYSDPYNRGTYPWGKEDRDLLEWHRRLIRLRKEYDVLRDGEFLPFSVGEDVLGFRSRTSREELIVCVNRSQFEEVPVEIPLGGRGPRPDETQGHGILALELLSGERLPVGGLASAPVSSTMTSPMDPPASSPTSPSMGSTGPSGSTLLQGPMDSAVIKSSLRPLEGKIFYMRRKKARTSASPFSMRSCGILLHITSLPSRWGIGDMGKEAERFVDFLAASGQRLWQILPLNPPGRDHSPYQSPSVMAGNTLLISPDRLQDEGLLTEEEIQEQLASLARAGAVPDRVDYALTAEVKEWLFRRAWPRFRTQMSGGEVDPGHDRCMSEDRRACGTSTVKSSPDRGARTHEQNHASRQSIREERAAYEAFLKENKSWLDDYCLYMALKKREGGLPWVEWGENVALRDPKALESVREEVSDEIEYQRFLQYTFFRQWQRLKIYANGKGIRIVGDMPIYVAADSCDTWANRRLFKLDARGNPEAVAGVPPDYFSETGQLWGNPVYHWGEMEKDGFAWWKDRIRQSLKNCDYVRLDHFRGFEAFWEVPAGEETAKNGRWLKGPGKRLFETLQKEFGELPFIAEDLGYITAEVRNLRRIVGLPGMRVYQFEASPGESQSDEDKHCVYYSGTHDNDTLVGWYMRRTGKESLSPRERKAFLDQTLQVIYASDANWVIIPFQDVLGLDSTARMNTPGTTSGNWTWRMRQEDLTQERSEWLRTMALKSGRWCHDAPGNAEGSRDRERGSPA